VSNEYASSADRGSSSEATARSVDPGKTARTSALSPSASRGSAVQLSRGGAAPAPSAAPVDDPFALHLPAASADQIAATAGANGIQLKRDAAVQLAGDGAGLSDDQVVDTAHRGVSGPGQALPHADVIPRSFGRHDVGGIDAHVGGAAAQAATSMGAVAYATGNAVAFAGTPDLHTAAHEAAHVVQQRAGVSFKGVGQAGDRYEQHADAVADAVVAGGSAESLLDQMAGGASVQQKAGDSVQRIEDETLAARADAPEAAASGAAPTAEPDAVGVFISYVKLAALPDWMPEIASHCFIAFDDGWTAGFTKVGDDSKTDARVHIPEPRAAESGVHRVEARRKSDATSRGKTSAQIKQQIKTYAETVSPGRYNLITNNCGMWVKRALGQAWLVPETPGYVY
jgi:Domain of unknown function (DUF4157)